MTDPMDAFRTLQPAIDSGDVQLEPCEIFDHLKVIVDHPMGELRLTYVSMSGGQAAGIVQFVKADPFNNLPCFSIGYAVHESLRKQGLATRIVADALAELENGLRGTSLKRYYVEAVVSTSNEASKRIASRFISDAPVSITDEFSGEPALQYMRLFPRSG
ncbi:MAG TPA: GNAT family protein [Gemmatimonadales bacterium]|jgi:hypothetical protein